MNTGSNPLKDDLIKQLRESLSRDELSSEAKISNYTITKYDRKKITDLGREIIKLRKQKMSLKDIAKKLKCSKSTVSSYSHYIDPDNKIRKELTKNRLINDHKSVILKQELKWLNKHKNAKYSGSFNYQMTRSLRTKIIEYYNNTCMLCNGKFQTLDFHHIDPNEKEFDLSEKNRQPIDKILKEANKCSLICSDCHKKVHRIKKSDLPKINIEIKDLSKIELNNIVIKEIDRQILDFFCHELHYLGNSNKGSIYNIGFYHNEELIAIALITNTVRQGSKINGESTCELSRFLIVGRHRTKNLASKCLSLLIKFIKSKKKYKWLISFADTGHHLGTIYKAANFIELGITKPSYNYEGIHKKTVYERAKKLDMTEYEYARFFDLERIKEDPKIKFGYQLIKE